MSDQKVERKQTISQYRKGQIVLAVGLAVFVFFPVVAVYFPSYIAGYAAFYLGIGAVSLMIKCPRCGTNIYRGKHEFYMPWPNRNCTSCNLDLTLTGYSDVRRNRD